MDSEDSCSLADWVESAVLTESGTPKVVAWGLDHGLATEVGRVLNAGQDPQAVASHAWAVVALRADGSVVATCSPAYQAGLCWARRSGTEGPELIIAPFLGAVVSASDGMGLDEDFAARRFGLPNRHRDSPTPFGGVGWVAPGLTATWPTAASDPHLRAWFGGEAWGEPVRGGPDVVGEYLKVFDAAVDALVPDEGPICAGMSGGLDSTFVVASLARHARPDRPIHAFVHSPLSAARLSPRGNWDPDDFPFAAAMTRRFPTIVLHRVINDELRQPLEVAEESARRLWLTVPNPLNHPWLRQIDEMAADLGAVYVFGGGRGNLAFSDSHMYAAGYHLGRGQWSELAAIARPYPGEPDDGILIGPALLARQLGSSVREQRRSREPLTKHHWSPFVPDAMPSAWAREGTPRQRYLRNLAARGYRRLTYAHAGWDVPQVDPFATETVMNFAAAMKPSAWARAGRPRGFARLAARGRLPDEIRLRTRRGAQAWDAWFIIHNQFARHLEAAEGLIDDPTLGSWVDADALVDELREWPWGQPHVDPPESLHPVMDLLSFGVAWRTLRTMVST